MLTRWIIALATFVIVILIGMVTIGNFGTGIDTGNFFDTEGANSFALIGAVALVVAFIAYAAVEYAQTGGFASIASQFDTRTIVLMPIAIAINIILGATVANALKLPIYLDSIGTILVGALAGPVAGALTGFLSNTLWTYVIPPPFQNGPAAAFGIVAVVIGVLAGLAGRAGCVRVRIAAAASWRSGPPSRWWSSSAWRSTPTPASTARPSNSSTPTTATCCSSCSAG